MWIGAARIVLDFYNNEKAAVKRKALESLCKDLRKTYNISILEIADFDDPERCVIGFAVVMPQHWNERSSRAFIDKICKTIDETAFARVSSIEPELFSHGDYK